MLYHLCYKSNLCFIALVTREKYDFLMLIALIDLWIHVLSIKRKSKDNVHGKRQLTGLNRSGSGKYFGFEVVSDVIRFNFLRNYQIVFHMTVADRLSGSPHDLCLLVSMPFYNSHPLSMGKGVQPALCNLYCNLLLANSILANVRKCYSNQYITLYKTLSWK